jgi:hypothetical protein
MTAYVEELGGRDEIAELIERHFQIVRVLLPNDQADRVCGRPGQMLGSYIHCKVL